MKLSSIVSNTILPIIAVVVSNHHINANEYHTDDGNVAFSAELDFHGGFTIDDLQCPGHTHPHTDFVTSSMAVHMVDYMNNEMDADMTLLEVLQGIEIFEDEEGHYDDKNNDDDDSDDDDSEQRRDLGEVMDGYCFGTCIGFSDIPADAWKDSRCSWDQVESGHCNYYFYLPGTTRGFFCDTSREFNRTRCVERNGVQQKFIYSGAAKCSGCWEDDFDKRRTLRGGQGHGGATDSLEEYIARGVKRDINEKCTGEQELNMIKTLHFSFDLN